MIFRSPGSPSSFCAHDQTLALNDAAEYLEMAALTVAKHQGADAPSAQRRVAVGGSARGAGASSAGVPADARSGGRPGTARRAAPESVRPRLHSAAPAAPQAPLALSLSELLAAVDRVLRAVTQPRLHEIVPRALDLPGAIATIRGLLALRAHILWTEFVQRDADPWQVLSALLGVLELARLGEVRVRQPRPFANVEIRRDPAGEAA